MLKEDVVYISNRTLLLTSHKKDGIMPSSAIDGPWRYYAKWYNLEKDKKLWFHALVGYKKTNKKFKNTPSVVYFCIVIYLKVNKMVIQIQRES